MSGIYKAIKGDKIIWIIVILLSLISLIAVYSSSSSLAYREGKSEFFFLLKQMRFVILGLVILYICHRIPLGWYRKLTPFLYLVSIALLLATLFMGTTLNDGTRWLRVFGFSFQTAEFAKIALILYVAKAIEDNRTSSFKQFCIWIFAPIVASIVLIFWGSISTAAILSLTILLLLLVAGIPSNYIWKMAAIAGSGLVIIVVLALFTPAFPRIHTGISRLTTFVDSEEEVNQDKDFQARHAKIAVASGGIVGKLPGNSTQRYVLPHPYSDFIFAIIVEETGVLGAIVVIFLYLCLFYRIIIVVKGCSKPFTTLLVGGLGILIVLQSMIHMCVNVGLFPVTGQTLPLISLGGTSIVATSIAFGIILCVSRSVDDSRQEALEATASLKLSVTEDEKK